LASSRASALHRLGRHVEGITALREALGSCGGADDDAEFEAHIRLAQCHHVASEPRNAIEVLDAAEARGLCADTLGSHDGRIALAIRIACEGEMGRFDRVEALYERLAVFAEEANLMRPYLLLYAANRHLMQGELRALPPLLESVREDAGEMGLEHLVILARIHEEELRAIQGAPPRIDGFSLGGDAPVPRAYLAASITMAGYRRGMRLDPGLENEAEETAKHSPEFEFVMLLVEAHRAAAAGDLRAAMESAERCATGAERRGLRCRALEAWLLQAELLARLGEPGDARRRAWAERITSRAEDFGSARFAAHGLFHRATISLDLMGLAQVAEEMEAAPRAGRWASSLLGDEVPLDEFDRALLEALRPRMPQLTRAGSGDALFVLGAEGTLRAPGGTRLALGKRSRQRGLLASLVARGGEASKEELLADAWGVESYHPFRHDNRLHATIRKLRAALSEADAPSPLITTEGGYALGASLLIESAS
ncbi:MAG: helix-turn-helix domain-containing protein, partial [Myxococcales bacterium]|nr:helix-turn-helix domain-containing protein [Myxococcales bacterium]